MGMFAVGMVVCGWENMEVLFCYLLCSQGNKRNRIDSHCRLQVVEGIEPFEERAFHNVSMRMKMSTQQRNLFYHNLEW